MHVLGWIEPHCYQTVIRVIEPVQTCLHYKNNVKVKSYQRVQSVMAVDCTGTDRFAVMQILVKRLKRTMVRILCLRLARCGY